MAISTVDDIVAGLNSAQQKRFFKFLGTNKSNGSFQSGWLAKGVPGAGVAPPLYTNGSGYTCDKSTVGAIDYANGITQNWLARAFGSGNASGALIIADRLWSCSGMGFAASTYAVTTPGSLPARITDGGLGCELWIENFVASGAASGTLTANYLDSASGSKSGVVSAVVSAPVLGQLQQVPLQDNLGISQLTNVVTSATWTSGTFGMTIMKRLVEIPVPIIGVGGSFDFADLGLPKIPNDACLMLLWMATATTAANVIGSISIIDK